MRRFLVALALTVAAAGCDEDPGTQADQLCTKVCACQSSLPSVQRLCFDDCRADFNPTTPAPPGCLECILAQSCETLFDDTCDPFCSSPVDSSPLETP